MANLNEAQTRAAREALAEVCRVLASDTFARQLRARTWLAGCPLLPGSTASQVSGEAVLAVLRAGIPDFTLYAEKTGWSSTIAMTDVARREIRIRPDRYDLWERDARGERAALANTLAHEMTHLIAAPGYPGAYRFTDSRYWLPWCGRDRMVSYGVGDLVEEIWTAGAPQGFSR